MDKTKNSNQSDDQKNGSSIRRDGYEGTQSAKRTKLYDSGLSVSHEYWCKITNNSQKKT